MLALGLVMYASPAFAQTYTGVRPPAVPGVLNSSGVGPGASPAAAASAGQILASQVSAQPAVAGSARAQGGGLAFTGGDVLSLAMFAIPLIAVGTVLVRRGRPQQSRIG
jgi:hypothetical protein